MTNQPKHIQAIFSLDKVISVQRRGRSVVIKGLYDGKSQTKTLKYNHQRVAKAVAHQSKAFII